MFHLKRSVNVVKTGLKLNDNMPELPEVETVVRTLENLIKGRKIVNVNILHSNIISMDDDKFCEIVINQTFRDFKRRGKYILFELDYVTLVSHLRMEGKYFYQSKEDEIGKHTHVIFDLDNGMQLRYDDVRKFGRMELIELQPDYRVFKKLGPEPFDDVFNLQYIKKYISKSNKNLKIMLLDQSFVAGIGNIYADEICFRSKLLPQTLLSHISDEKWKIIIEETRNVLNEAILNGGSTIRSYTSSLGVNGLFQLKIDVYGRANEKCHRCDEKIVKIKLNQRGTHYCPNCQKLK